MHGQSASLVSLLPCGTPVADSCSDIRCETRQPVRVAMANPNAFPELARMAASVPLTDDMKAIGMKCVAVKARWYNLESALRIQMPSKKTVTAARKERESLVRANDWQGVTEWTLMKAHSWPRLLEEVLKDIKARDRKVRKNRQAAARAVIERLRRSQNHPKALEKKEKRRLSMAAKRARLLAARAVPASPAASSGGC